MKKHSQRLGNLELRAVDRYLLNQEAPETMEIVKWVNDNYGKRFCYTVVYWRKDDEGFYAHFVGDRFMDTDTGDLMALMVDAQNMLNGITERKSE